VVIGIDGATWSIARPLMRAGHLPNLARLARSAAWGDLDTLKPSLSPAIWTTIATGYLPERHGILGFTVTVPGTGVTTLPGTNERREPAVWTLASASGKRTGVVNWWATFPAESLNGFMVSDRANLHRRFGYRGAFGLSDPALEVIGAGETWPPSLMGHLLVALGGNERMPPEAVRLLLDPLPAAYRRELDSQPKLQRDNRLSVLKFLILQDHATRVAARLAIRELSAPDLLMVYFSGVDAIEHQFWAYYEPQRYGAAPPAEDVAALGTVLPSYYEYADALVGDVLAAAPPEALVIVISDHGHEPNPQYRPDAAASDYGRWTSGTHSMAPPGIILFAGPGVRPQHLSRTSVLDLAPTILALLGVPPSKDMSGRVITEAFTDDLRRSLVEERAARHVSPATTPPLPTPSQVDPELLEKFRALGYIR
jgi:predicted AlkP superfamily phosphohydrolase/phosphomutase